MSTNGSGDAMPEQGQDGGITRRRFVRDASVATVVAADALAGPALAARPKRRRNPRPTVAVFGGGIAGLTAAHELVERGFDVTVYERRALGGKARSMSVPSTASGGRRPLPAEHSWRSFFGNYRNLPDTLERIPLAATNRSVRDRLVATSTITAGRANGREDLHIPFVLTGPQQPPTPEFLLGELTAVMQTGASLPPAEAAFFARRLAVFLTSSDARRLGQWERISWWDFIAAEGMSGDYRAIANMVPRAVALRPRLASARSVGRYWEIALSFVTGEGQEGGADQVLDAPTNEAFIVPWVDYLRSRGVRFWRQEIERLDVRRGRLASVRLRDRHGRRRTVRSDWFVCALPVERARRLWTADVLRADPRLADLHGLQTVWANGIQFYLRREVPIVRGHYFCIDSPWAISGVTHAQFWQSDFANTYGNGRIKDCLSLAVVEFDEPGIVYGKPARQCTPSEFAREVWAQLKAHLDDTGTNQLPDDVPHSWFIDPGLKLPNGRRRSAINDDPLFLCSVDSWRLRPEPPTAIPNLFLAGDYLKTNIDAATMEGANESARQAVNALLARAEAPASPVAVHALHAPPALEAAKRADAQRYKSGEPHILDSQ